MMSTTTRYLVRFAVHITSTYRDNFLAELAETAAAETQELSSGCIAIKGFRPKESGWILDVLKQEQRRGALTIEDSDAT